MENITLKQAENFAKNGNINGVAAFFAQQKQKDCEEYDRVSYQTIKETLMKTIIDDCSSKEMDEFLFSNIKRVANL